MSARANLPKRQFGIRPRSENSMSQPEDDPRQSAELGSDICESHALDPRYNGFGRRISLNVLIPNSG
jgi:hypothetical protein